MDRSNPTLASWTTERAVLRVTYLGQRQHDSPELRNASLGLARMLKDVPTSNTKTRGASDLITQPARGFVHIA